MRPCEIGTTRRCVESELTPEKVDELIRAARRELRFGAAPLEDRIDVALRPLEDALKAQCVITHGGR